MVGSTLVLEGKNQNHVKQANSDARVQCFSPNPFDGHSANYRNNQRENCYLVLDHFQLDEREGSCLLYSLEPGLPKACNA